jgi:hypothetical protein
VYVFDGASTLDGEVEPVAILGADNAATITLDRVSDRLYVGTDYAEAYYTFDSARTLSASVLPTRTVTWGWDFNGPAALAVDGCRDRLYLASNNSTPGGYHVVVFDAASTVDGVIDPDADADADARLDVGQCISSVVDTSGRLHCFADSATEVRIYENPEAFTGDVVPVPSRVIQGVLNEGYGLDVSSY